MKKRHAMSSYADPASWYGVSCYVVSLDVTCVLYVS